MRGRRKTIQEEEKSCAKALWLKEAHELTAGRQEVQGSMTGEGPGVMGGLGNIWLS